MPGSTQQGTEVPLAVRAFRGVMLAEDPAFIGGDFLQRANNWLPDQTRVLAKRRGTAAYQSLADATKIDRMTRVVGDDGTRFLYVVAHFGVNPDAVWVSTNDGAFAAVTGGAFATGAGARYGMTRLGGTLYVGNDVDPVKAIPLGGSATDLDPLALADDTAQAVSAVADTSAGMLPGTYSYRWAIYDTATKRWTAIGPARTTTISGAGWFRLLFTAPQAGAPATVLGADEKWHLCLAGVDQEIEGAHDQTPEGLAAAGTYTAMAVTADGAPVPTPSTVMRHARMLVTHRGTIIGAGDVENPRRVWGSSVIPAGLEQALFEQGIFFPATAYVDLPAAVTGLAVASLTSTQRSPTAPLACFTETSTHFAIGDLVDDPTFQFLDVSTEVGCVSDRTIVQTPVGLLFLGQDSVYLLPPQLAEPVRVGWPIERALRAIPSAARPFCWADYHKGFYVLACAPPGGIDTTLQWRLDLRQGLTDPPSWWDSRHPAYTAFTRSRREPTEDDRGYAAVTTDDGCDVVLVEQPNSYTDLDVPIVSDFKSARLTQGPGGQPAPLQPKVAKRVRAIAKVGSTTSLGVTVRADGALMEPGNAIQVSGSLPLPGAGRSRWNVARWNIDRWSSERESKGTFLVSGAPLRGLAFEVTITHNEAVPITLRDIELRVQPAERDWD